MSSVVAGNNSMYPLLHHVHGKQQVDVCRVWKLPGALQGGALTYSSVVREWSCDITLHSPDMAKAYLVGDNTGMTATDTMKNTVYRVAKQQARPCGPEEFAARLARHYVNTYPLLTGTTVRVRQKSWERYGGKHVHGFTGSPTAPMRVAEAEATRVGGGGVSVKVTSTVSGLELLKTTQSGYEGYIRDEATSLPETRERMLGTCATASWVCHGTVSDYDRVYDRVLDAMLRAFFGPDDKGVYSPSVQYTLHKMASAALDAVPAVASVTMEMPNLHYLPTPPLTKFEDDVYVVAPNPHGLIRATVVRDGVGAASKL